MNLNQLYYFKELAKQQQFSKAAQKLNISQPSLSNSIKSLENKLSCSLIKREHGRILLTKYGQIFYQAATTSISTLEKAKRDIKQAQRLEANIIEIGCIPTAINSYLPKIIAQFQENNPGTKFIYHNALSRQICTELIKNNYDLGICSKLANYRELKFVPLYTEKIVVITKKNNPLARHPFLTPHDLRKQPILTYSKETAIGQKITQELLVKEPKLQIVNKSYEDLSIAAQVLANNSIAVVANTFLLSGFNVAKIRLKIPQDTRIVYLAYNPKANLHQSTDNLINFIQKKASL